MEIIALITFGSHLYGTATPESDLDIKGVYMPVSRDILLQRVQEVISPHKREKGLGEKNVATDVDCDLYSPAKYLSLLAQGQMIALDMFYAPENVLISSSPTWNALRSFAPSILTKQAASFVRYCTLQANKYCIKGARIETARRLLELLKKEAARYGNSAKLGTIANELREFASTHDCFTLGVHYSTSGTPIEYFEIAGKKGLLTSSVKTAITLVQNILDEYGERAYAAATNEGIDWKALSHAVRIGHQAVEFLMNQHITFPRPEAPHLRAIKRGEVAFDAVTQEIEELLAAVEEAKRNSLLPESYDQTMLDDFIEDLYLNQIKKGQV